MHSTYLTAGGLGFKKSILAGRCPEHTIKGVSREEGGVYLELTSAPMDERQTTFT